MATYSNHPLALVLTGSRAAYTRVRPRWAGGVEVCEYLVVAELEHSGTDYKALVSLGDGPAAAIAAASKARSITKGVQVRVHAAQLAIVTGKHKHIALKGVTLLQPLHPVNTNYFEVLEK